MIKVFVPYYARIRTSTSFATTIIIIIMRIILWMPPHKQQRETRRRGRRRRRAFELLSCCCCRLTRRGTRVWGDSRHPPARLLLAVGGVIDTPPAVPHWPTRGALGVAFPHGAPSLLTLKAGWPVFVSRSAANRRRTRVLSAWKI